MYLQMHGISFPANLLKQPDGALHAGKRNSGPGAVAGLVRAHEGKGHDVHAARHYLLRKLLGHDHAAGGGGHRASGPSRKRHEIHEIRIQKRLAPALKMHPPRPRHGGPERRKGLRAHMSALPHVGARGVRTVRTLSHAAGCHLHLQTFQLARLKKIPQFLKKAGSTKLREKPFDVGCHALPPARRSSLFPDAA